MVYVEDVSQERPDLDTDEGYTIDVPTSGIGAVSAKTVFGALRALETFSQLVRFDFDSGRYVIDGAPWRIEDRPRFPHRGLMVDTSRHFQSLASLRAIIDTLPYAKINVLHWHIVDAQSFPFESKSSPKLWQGSYSPSERYTQVDAASIVEYARLRGVRVVPEFDMPGHADSWCVGYPHICPSTTCRTPLNVASNATFDLIEALLSEVTGNKPGAGLFPDSFLHLGGDEVNTDCWTKTPAVAAWLKAHNMTADQGYAHFTKRVATMALEQGRRPVQWNEVYDHFKTALPKKTVVHVWTSVTNVTEVAANGYNMLRNMGYFNYSWYLDNLNVDWRGVYQNEPCESIPTEELCKKVLGGHGEMWGETVDASDLQQTVWPRMASIAEKLWSSREHTQDVAAALPRIQNFRCLLLERGVAAAPVENAMARSAPAGPGSCYPRPGAAEVRGFQQLMI
mmetsp:Transcript_81338/g.246776  ORF Transcript_81338/g.246776 Transcript_81338/m.246776 type:complete len:452 (+) Transcript_81338:3-1358(+)